MAGSGRLGAAAEESCEVSMCGRVAHAVGVRVCGECSRRRLRMSAGGASDGGGMRGVRRVGSCIYQSPYRSRFEGEGSKYLESGGIVRMRCQEAAGSSKPNAVLEEAGDGGVVQL